MRLTATCIALMGLYASSCKETEAKMLLTKQQVLEDANQVERYLKKYHPNLYSHRSPKELKRLWVKYKSQIADQSNYLDAVTLYQKMLAAVCDEHTGVQLDQSLVSQNLRDNRVFPFGLVLDGKDIYLDNLNYKNNPQKLSFINRKSSVDIQEFLRSLDAADGCQNSSKLFSYHIRDPYFSSVLLTNFVGDGSTYDVKYKAAESEKSFENKIPSASKFWLLNWKNTRTRGRSEALKAIDISFDEYLWKFEENSKEQFLVLKNTDQSIYYLYVPSFYGGEKQAELIDKALPELVKANPDHVIIDLTGNRGGRIENSQRLLSYFLTTSSRVGTHVRSKIWKTISDSNFSWDSDDQRKHWSSNLKYFRQARKRNGQYKLRLKSRSFGNKSYKGELTVLVSPTTASAATFAAIMLKQKANATIVGDIGDASMLTTCASSPGTHLLKHSKVKIEIPIGCYDRDPGARKKGNLNRPKVPVDIFGGRFTEVNLNILKTAIANRVAPPSEPARDVAKPVLEPKIVAGEAIEGNVASETASLKNEPTGQSKRVSLTRELHECDILAASPYDDEKLGSGVPIRWLMLDPQPAIEACSDALEKYPDDLATIYQFGRSLHAGKLYGRAFRLYQRAAMQGHLLAKINLSAIHSRKKTVHYNPDKAFQLTKEVAESGAPFAQYAHGYMHYIGLGTPKDYGRAHELFAQAAKGNISEAQFMLGFMRLHGIEVLAR